MPDHRPQESLWRFVRLVGLCAVSIAQPLFDVLGAGADFFVAHGSMPGEILLFVAAVYLGLPAGLFFFTLVVGVLGEAAAALARACLAGVLIGVAVGFGFMRVFDINGSVAVVVEIAAAGIVTVVYFANQTLRGFASVIGVLSPCIPLLFLCFSPVAALVWPVPSALPQHEFRAPDTSVLVLVFDELPLLSLVDESGHIDSLRAPNFAKLATDATWFRNATAVSDGTSLAIPAILTGRRANQKQLANFDSHPENLFTLFAPTHKILARESSTSICPPELCRRFRGSLMQNVIALVADSTVVGLRTLLPTPLTRRLPRVDDRWADFLERHGRSEISEIFREFSTSFSAVAGAKFGYLHVNFPHAPWNHLPSGQRYGAPDVVRYPFGLVNGVWKAKPEFADRGLQRHLLQVGYADRLLGELVAHLKLKGLYDETLLVVVSDHGVSFEPGEPWRSVTPRNHVELMAIPFFIKAPHQGEGAIHDRNVETIDVLPTIVDLMGVEVPWNVDGQSALDPSLEERPGKEISRFGYAKSMYFGSVLGDWPRALASRMRRTSADARLDRFFDVGPHVEIVGRHLDQMTVEYISASPAEVLLDDPGAFDSVDLSGEALPVHITGSLRSKDRLPEALAFVLNGVVRATSTPFDDPSRGSPGQLRFEVLIPPAALVSGFNRLGILAIEGEAESLRFAGLLLGKRPSYTVEAASEDEVALRRSDGVRLPVREDGSEGRLEVVEGGSRFVNIEGYAFAKFGGRFQVPSRFIVFIDGSYVYQGAQNRMRAEFARQHRNNDVARCGFKFRLAYEQASRLTPRDVAVYALFDEAGAPFVTALD